jgi:hypothetical protein
MGTSTEADVWAGGRIPESWNYEWPVMLSCVTLCSFAAASKEVRSLLPISPVARTDTRRRRWILKRARCGQNQSPDTGRQDGSGRKQWKHHILHTPLISAGQTILVDNRCAHTVAAWGKVFVLGEVIADGVIDDPRQLRRMRRTPPIKSSPSSRSSPCFSWP